MERAVEELKRQLQSTGRSGLGFDLDGTVSNTVGWWMEGMLQNFGNPEGLSVAEMIAKYRYVELVPYWKGAEVEDWIKHHRTSNEVQEQLPLIEGANEKIQKIDQEVLPVVAYITARPEVVRRGTQRWLEKFQFPPAPIIMPPFLSVNSSESHQWKANVLTYLYPEMVGYVDDNPGLIDFLPRDYLGYIWLYGGSTSARDGLNIFECPNWQEVYSKMSILRD